MIQNVRGILSEDLNNGKMFFNSFLMELSDPEDKKDYHEFNTERASPMTIRYIVVVALMFTIYFLCQSLLYAPSENKAAMYLVLIFTVGLRQPMFLLFLYVKRIQENPPYTKYSRLLVSLRSHIQNLLVLSTSVTVGLSMIARIYNGPCTDSLKQEDMYSCNSEWASRALPQEHIIMLMLLPIIASIVYKRISYPYILLSWTLTIAFIVCGIIMANATVSIPALVVYAPFSLLILYENERQNLILYFSVKRQKKLLVENKLLAEETTTEMRHMIANVAHDLKTPLAAFMNGIETVSEQMNIITDKQAHFLIQNEAAVKLDLTPDLQYIKDQIRNLINTNSFMTMTINRCIDYTKASNGLKLAPRLETVQLHEVLHLPINCMQEMQSRVVIQLLPIPDNVCTHIITDKQWLQENLFCLMSNAVKYSSNGGIVTIAVSLCTSNCLPKRAKAALLDPIYGLNNSEQSSHSSNSLYQDGNLIPFQRNNVSDRTTSVAQSTVHTTIESSSSKHNSIRRKVYSIFKRRDMKIYSSTTMNNDDVTVCSANSQTVLLFEIEDTGIGLSDEFMSKLFTPFKQAQRRAGGTGLGLYSLAKRIEALGGYYGVQRRKDQREGSLFWFAIPYNADQTIVTVAPSMAVSTYASVADLVSLNASITIDVQSNRHSPNGAQSIVNTTLPISSNIGTTDTINNVVHTNSSTPPSNKPKLNILVVDDSPTILKMTTAMLRKQGHTVSQAEDGAEALKKIAETYNINNNTQFNSFESVDTTTVLEEKDKFDIVLMDLNMPVMDGLEATTRLRALEKVHNAEIKVRSQKSDKTTPIIEIRHQFIVGFSANSDHDTMLEAYTAGVDDFICKPFAMQTFYDVYNKYIQQQKGV